VVNGPRISPSLIMTKNNMDSSCLRCFPRISGEQPWCGLCPSHGDLTRNDKRLKMLDAITCGPRVSLIS
jgi:hypothetical protein